MQVFYDALIKNISEGVISIDKRGKIVIVNETAEMILGVTSKDIMGKNFTDLFRLNEPHFSSKPSDLVEEVLFTNLGQTFTISEVNISNITAENSYCSLLVPVRDLRDNLLGLHVIISESGEDQDLINRIQRRVQFRAIADASSAIGHNLNNILMVILNSVNILRLDCQEVENIDESLSDIEMSIEKAKKWTKQLLKFSGNTNIMEDYVSYNDLIENIIGINIMGGNYTISTNVSKNLSPINISKTHLGNILSNIAINARESMPNGGTVTINAENFDIKENSIYPLKEGKYVKIEIKDNGDGIPEEDIDMVFEPYFTTKREKGAQGLGLTIAKALILQYKGYIKIESEFGEGTNVIIILPAGKYQEIKALTTDSSD